MRKILSIIPILLCNIGFAQVEQFNIVNRDSFSPEVKKVTLNCYLHNDDPELAAAQSSVYWECDTTGKWVVRIETFSDGDESHDTVKYDPKTRTRIVVKANDFEPSKSTTVYNKDGTVKSYLAEPGQRDAQLTEYEYDNARRVIRRTLSFVENKTVETFLYDENGKLLNYKRSSGSVTAKKLQLDYEEKYEYEGNLSSIRYGFYYGANEQVRVRDTVVCTYDAAYRLVSKMEIVENGSWKRLTTYDYDAAGRIIHEQVESVTKDSNLFSSHKNMEYDSLGYYSLYIVEELSYGFSNRWTTLYNEKGLPVDCYFETPAETFHYVWEYEFR